jgi:hypothetical protein
MTSQDSHQFPPVFATNNSATGQTVAGEINRLLRGLREAYVDAPTLAFATAYMNPQGFDLIADEMELAPRVRILLGAEPVEPFRTQLERGQSIKFESAAEEHLQDLKRDRDLLGFTVQADRAARRLVAWLRSTSNDGLPRVDVRRYTRGFLHGKAYIAEHPMLPAVLAGSSNLTLAGLSWNRELNLGYPSGQHTGLVIDWYNELWDDSEPFDLASLYESRWQEHAPGVVFLRMLYELYGEFDDKTAVDVGLPVTTFQLDGIRRAQRILDELGGVLVCDEVGLGKTFIAGEFIKQVTQRDRQKALIVVPASLKTSTWEPFLKAFDLISARVDLVTYDDVRNGTKPGVRPGDLDDYSLVVIDEAHNLRNPATLTAEAVIRLLWGEHPKKVLLLTATPVNNSLRDLQTLIGYFVRNDAEFANIGIPSVIDYIKSAQARDPETLSAEHLFDLMDKVAVRRTRRFIKQAYANDRIRNNVGELVYVEFPTPEVHRITYQLDDDSRKLADEVIYALEVSDDEHLVIRSGEDRDPNRLSLGRFASSVYRWDHEVDRLQITNVGLLRSMLLKRLESSTAAIEVTLRRLIDSHRAFQRGLSRGFVIIGDALREYASSEAESVEEFLAGLDDESADQVAPCEEFDLRTLEIDVAGDIALFERLYQLAVNRRREGPDSKLLRLVQVLGDIAEESERPDRESLSDSERRKVIIFSTYADTVSDVHECLNKIIDDAPLGSPLAVYRGRLAPAVFGAQGSEGQLARAEILAGFCPRTAGELKEDGSAKTEDRFDILVTSDVLAEGVNLQQAGHMVNYDLPWNPMKLVQRHGRIDRIGSPHKRISIDCFFPGEDLDRLLGLEETLQRKIAYANAAVGVGAVLPNQVADPSVEVLLHDVRSDIEDIYNEDATLLISGGGSEAISGEEYRRRLSDALASSNVKRDILGLPFGAGSGFNSLKVAQSGYIFCVSIGDEPKPWFRFVAVDSESWEPLTDEDGQLRITDDTLTCLMAADPGTSHGVQVVSDTALERVFDAWEAAQADVYAKWTFLTDKANLQPKIEKALREAYALVTEHGEFLGLEQLDILQAKLNGRWDSGVVKAIRQIVRSDDAPKVKVQEIDRFVTDAGLPIPQAIKPLRPVRREDVRVVCWMAVQPAPPASWPLTTASDRRQVTE